MKWTNMVWSRRALKYADEYEDESFGIWFIEHFFQENPDVEKIGIKTKKEEIWWKIRGTKYIVEIKKDEK